jgi:hypothetical protein
MPNVLHREMLRLFADEAGPALCDLLSWAAAFCRDPDAAADLCRSAAAAGAILHRWAGIGFSPADLVREPDCPVNVALCEAAISLHRAEHIGRAEVIGRLKDAAVAAWRPAA